MKRADDKQKEIGDNLFQNELDPCCFHGMRRFRCLRLRRSGNRSYLLCEAGRFGQPGGNGQYRRRRVEDILFQ